VANLTEHAFAVPTEVEPGILRLTLPLPSGPKHVHCYLLRGDDGWTLVDTGLGLMETPPGRSPGRSETTNGADVENFPTPRSGHWDEIVAQLDAPVARIFITHMHPDHVGGARAAADATAAPVIQGRVDYAQCERVWGSDDWPEQIAAWFLTQGVPEAVAEELIESGHVFADFVRYVESPQLVDPGDEIDGWTIIATPGHADGHLSLLKDGVLIAGDTLLAPITPAIGLYPASRPDPLGDYLETLGRIEELAPRVSYGGHGATIDEPAARAREIAVHHEERLAKTEAALRAGPRTGYEVSLDLFGTTLPPIQRRFAVAEALSHLERLVAEGRAYRSGDDRGVAYTAPSAGGRDTA
jgi:glyoxylase-like metal-dependent hydrolase (beta-lactamase superfamily II)